MLPLLPVGDGWIWPHQGHQGGLLGGSDTCAPSRNESHLGVDGKEGLSSQEPAEAEDGDIGVVVGGGSQWMWPCTHPGIPVFVHL